MNVYCEFLTGDIFESGCQALVNPVNCHGVMGKGLALEFRNRFPENFKIYKDYCAEGLMKTGKCLVTFDAPTKQCIINFPTKDSWRKPAEYDYIARGLYDLRFVIKQNHIRSIAIPALGCGLGALDWDKVSDMILAEFRYTNHLHIKAYRPC